MPGVKLGWSLGHWVGSGWVTGVGRVCRVGDTGLGRWGQSGRVESGRVRLGEW
jgi:hypothetical protein